MQGRNLNIRSVSVADEAAWRDLGQRAVEPNPFYEPDCLIPAAEHQAFGSEIDLVVAEDGDCFYGVLPIRRVKRWRGLPYPIVTTQVRRMTYLGTPLIDASRGSEAVLAILSTLVDQRKAGGSRVLVIQEQTDGPTAALFRAAASELGLPLVVFESFERGFLTRHDPPAWQTAHSTKTLRGLQRKQRNLGKEMGGVAEIVDRGADPQAIEDYTALEASGYKAEAGVAMATVKGEPEYFRDMCLRFAADKRLHLLSLTEGTKTAAMICWVRSQDTLLQFKWSYDEQYSKHSPGILLHTEAMRYFDEHTDASSLDTCTWGENEMINRLYPDRRTIVSYFIPLSSSLRDRLVVNAFVKLRPLHRKIFEMIHPDKSQSALRGKLAPGSSSS
jgi:Acetyltransferase (GNAT) domain